MTFPFKLIDLTHTLDSTIPTWDGACGFHHDMCIDYTHCPDQDKFRVMKIRAHAGIGTHMDAPSHCIPGGSDIHDLDVQDLFMPCVVIDVSDKCHERYSLCVQDIASFEALHGTIMPHGCAMIRTGWEKFWHQPLRYRNNHIFPSVSPEAAYLLLERGVKALGIDTLSPDRPEDGFKVHKVFLGAHKIIIENVAYLNLMPPTGAYVLALPMKIRYGTEAPIRLIGLIKERNL